MHILLVDDMKFNLLNASRLMESFGHKVTSTTCCKQAIAWLSQGNQYDLVLTDFCMPDLNGIEFYLICQKELSAIRGIELPPFILFTTLQDESLETQALRSGFLALIRKPFTPQMVKELLIKIEAGELQQNNEKQEILVVSRKRKHLELLQEIITDHRIYFEYFEDMEAGFNYYNDNPDIKAVLLAKDLGKNKDVITFYERLNNSIRYSDTGLVSTPPFAIMFEDKDFQAREQLEKFVTQAAGVGLKDLVNLDVNPQRIKKIIGQITAVESKSQEAKDETPSIIVVDSSAFVRTMIKNYLNHLGKEVKEASNIEQAFRAYTRCSRVEAVIIDQTLRDGSAEELMQQCIEHQKNYGETDASLTDYILMGVQSDNHMESTYKQGGFAAYLQKPIDVSKIKNLFQPIKLSKTPLENLS